MGIDIQNEEVLSIAEAAKLLPGRPNVRTVWRWLDRGCRGCRLESVLVGGRRYTSVEAVFRFLEAINSSDGPATSPAASRARKRAIEAAERELAEAGI